ncbi:MAG: DUF2613 family protein [Actinomycetia bacterium]|nr:DUF2613 family protein [Actinomycetes bacterium]
MSPLAAAGSIVAGVVLALAATMGGVSAITPSSNPASDSENVVLYDAR